MARPPRAKSFEYLGFYRYLVTAGTCDRRPWFGDAQCARPIASQIPRFFGALEFDVVAFCIMPDHVHLLLEGKAPHADLCRAVSRWKQQTGYEWLSRKRGRLWQPGFHDRVLREADDTRAVVAYILQNPVRAGLVKRAGDYPWTGSARFTIAELAEHAANWRPSWK